MAGGTLQSHEVDDVYLHRTDRFVVSFVVGYADAANPAPVGVATSPLDAATAALMMLQDDNAGGTIWAVSDRQTGLVHQFRLREIQAALDAQNGESA
jgi:hypothetical protein